MEIITQSAARSQGLKRYYTGKPCRRGHIDERMVVDSYCLSCKRQRELTSAGSKAYRRRRYVEKRDTILSEAKAQYAITGPKTEYTAKWRKDNAEKIKQYRKDNAGLYAYHAASRRRLVRLATPSWADLDRIKAIYLEAARLTVDTGIPHHVDHIIPIKHHLVCGLHVPDNLQILKAYDNQTKNNKFTPVFTQN